MKNGLRKMWRKPKYSDQIGAFSGNDSLLFLERMKIHPKKKNKVRLKSYPEYRPELPQKERVLSEPTIHFQVLLLLVSGRVYQGVQKHTIFLGQISDHNNLDATP